MESIVKFRKECRIIYNYGRVLIDNTEIFNFQFVDRNFERKILEEFLDFRKIQNQLLWVNGERGTGKSFLVKEFLKSRTNLTYIYTNVVVGEAVPGNYIRIFLECLNKSANLNFFQFIKTNYKSIIDLTQRAVKVVLNLTSINDFGISDFSMYLTTQFMSHQNEKESADIVIRKYIQELLKKNTNIVLVFDNFSLCDKLSLDILPRIIHDLRQEHKIRFILCTTDKDLSGRSDIKSVIAERLPNITLNVLPFTDKNLFAHMVSSSCVIDAETHSMLSEVFKLCRGYPQRFREFLLNSYHKHEIVVDRTIGKALFSNQISTEVLTPMLMSFDIALLNNDEQLILHILALWGVPIDISILKEYIAYLIKEDPAPYITNEMLLQVIPLLENSNVITREFIDGLHIIQFEHDSLRIAAVKFFESKRSACFFHFSMYNFLRKNEENCNMHYYKKYYDWLLAYHAYAGHISGWIDLNFAFAQKLFEKRYYKDAESVFERLNFEINTLDCFQLMLFAKNEFLCGKYECAKHIFDNMDNRSCVVQFDLSQKIEFHLVRARTECCLLNSVAALDSVAEAEKLDTLNEEMDLSILGTKQTILYRANSRFHEAKILFDDLVQTPKDMLEMARIYSSAMDYYEGDESLHYLGKALTLAQRFSDTILEAKIFTNIAFEKLRMGEYDVAENLYKKSIQLLTDWQNHELSYPYSNLCVLEMIKGNWEQALDYNRESVFRNRSAYGSLVLKTNRMLCYYKIGNPEWNNLYKELDTYITSDHELDDKIYKKIGINLAFIAIKNQHTSKAHTQLERCRKHLANESPQGIYRYERLCYEANFGKLSSINNNSHYLYYYTKIEFEPWIVTYTHD